MKNILEINDLTLHLNGKVFFEDFNLTIPKKSFISIVAPNRSGKSLLTKVIAGIIPTNDKVIVDGISLNKEKVLTYLPKIGIVTNDLNQEFIFRKVKDELAFPLLNLGYSLPKVNKKIAALAKFFEIEKLLNKKIKTLTNEDKKKLLILIALIHEPKVLILDDAFLEISKKEQASLISKLTELTKRGLTVLNITSQLDTIYQSDKVLVLKQFKIVKETKPQALLEDYDYLKELNLKIPFLVDLAVKLQYCGLIDKFYFDLEELEGDLWK